MKCVTVFCLTVLAVVFGRVCPTEAIPITNGLIGYWSGDGTSNDLSGQNNHGTLQNGATFDTGIVDQAFRFNGSSYVEVPDSSFWTFTGDFTIHLWANFQSLGSGTVFNPEVIFIGHNEGSGATNKWFFALGGRQLNFHINRLGPGVFLVKSSFNPNLNQWYNLAVARSGNTYTIYVDGQVGGSESDSTVIPDANVPLRIGRNPNEAAFGLNGVMDEVAIYNRALSESEIQQLAAIPEPSTLALFTIATCGILGLGYRRRRQA